MKALLKKELKEHFLLFLIAVLISAFFQVATAFGFYLNVTLYKNSATLSNIPKDQIKMLQNMLKMIASPDKFFAGSFFSSSLIVLIAVIVLGIALWNSEIKNHTAEFLFSSGVSHAKIGLLKFFAGSIYIVLTVIILSLVSLFTGSIIYARITKFAGVFSQIGIKMPGFFNPSAVFALKITLMYFLGTELLFAISFVFAFLFLKKCWLLKALIPFVIYLVWGIFWNTLFGYPNKITGQFHKGLLFTSKYLWKFSFNSLYFSEQAAKPFEIVSGVLIAFAVISASIIFLFNKVEKTDKV